MEVVNISEKKGYEKKLMEIGISKNNVIAYTIYPQTNLESYGLLILLENWVKVNKGKLEKGIEDIENMPQEDKEQQNELNYIG